MTKAAPQASQKAEKGGITMMIPAKQLEIVWPDAQRVHPESYIDNLASGFNWPLCDPVHVSAVVKSPNIRHVIDGGGRHRAITKLYGGDELVPCIVHDDINTPEQAAKMTLELQRNRRGHKQIEQFRMKVTAKDQVAVAILGIITRNSYRVVSSVEENGICCINTVSKCYETYGAEALSKALAVIRDTWGADRHATSREIIRPYAALMFEFDGIDTERLAEVVSKKHTPGNLIGSAKGLGLKQLSRAIKYQVIQLYNYRLGEKKKLHPADL
jgi:hypothetical protein